METTHTDESGEKYEDDFEAGPEKTVLELGEANYADDFDEEVKPAANPSPIVSSSSTAASSRAASAGQWEDVRADEVRTGRRLGGGGFAVVFEGQFRGRAVAVKSVVDPSTAPAQLAAFLGELHAMAALGAHENIVRLLAACARPPRQCFVMELGGPSLFDVLHNRVPPAAPGLPPPAGADVEGNVSQSRPPDLVQRLHWALGTAHALAYLHSRRPVVIHRDVKSQNVVIAAPVDGGVEPKTEATGARQLWSCKLTDFGLVGTRETVAGTPAYMAPELLAAKPFGKAVDAYAFGVLLWELLEGRVPFAGRRPDEIKERVLRGERPCGKFGSAGDELLTREALGVLAGRGGAIMEAAVKAGRLVSRCWAQQAADRPEMAAVALELEALEEQAREVGGIESGKGQVKHEVGVQQSGAGTRTSIRHWQDHFPDALDITLLRQEGSKVPVSKR